MNAETGAGPGPSYFPLPGVPLTSEQRTAAQQAVDAASTAYTHDASTDVDERLRQELADRGVDAQDDWVAEVAHRLRSGHGVVLDPTLPGSLGGDNGGG